MVHNGGLLMLKSPRLPKSVYMQMVKTETVGTA